jgi:hypothetical protein
MLSASMWATWMLSESTYSTLHEWGHVSMDPWILSASIWVAWMLSESTYSTLHELGHVLVNLNAKCIYLGRLDAK